MDASKLPGNCVPPEGLPETPLIYCVEPLAFGKTSFSLLQRLTVPTGSPHVRGAAFYIPRLVDVPSNSFRIVSHAGSALLAITSVKVNDGVSGWMQIAVQAQTLDGSPAHGTHFCNIVAIGTELSAKKARAGVAEAPSAKRIGTRAPRRSSRRLSR